MIDKKIYLIVILIIIIFVYWFPFQNIIESYSPCNSHNVELPITNVNTCHNMCSTRNVCYYTGEQCTSDIDCPGCEYLYSV
jgi:hypothetical protein